MMTSPSSHRSRRILLLSILLNLSSTNTANAFSYIQNAAATSSSSRDGDNNNGSSSSASASSALTTARGRSAALAVAASAATITPFRGSINSRGSSISRQRTTRPGVGRQQRHRSTSSDDFALRMMDSMMQSSAELFENENEDGSDHEGGANNNNCQSTSTTMSESDDDETTQQEQQQQMMYERRNFLHGMLATTAAAAASSLSIPSTNSAANAYEQSYPLELQSISKGEVETSSNSITKLNQERITQKKLKVSATKNELRTDPLGIRQSPPSSLSSNNNNYILTIAGASTWALALWLASGSRSNPLVTPLANVLYDVNESSSSAASSEEQQENDGDSSDKEGQQQKQKQQQQWLTDRNEGYFGELPIEFMAILSAVFVFCGVIIDRVVYFLADGDAEVSFQLAGVSAIGGAVWEVGRLAAKEKAPTREEYDRDVSLYKEFEEFAKKRIVIGRGSCHRSDVINAFVSQYLHWWLFLLSCYVVSVC